MPASRTAQYLCDRVRERVGKIGDFNAHDRGKLRDGFLGDEGTADIAILPALNDALGQLLKTGDYKCRFSIGLPAAVVGVPTEIRKDPAIGAIELVTYQNCPLQKVSLLDLVGRYPRGWAGATNPAYQFGRPRCYYNDIPDKIGIFPSPMIADTPPNPDGTGGTYSLVILAESLADDLLLPTDFPARLDSQFHDDLVVWAAFQILDSVGQGSGAAMARAQMLRRDWDGANNSQSVIARVQALAQHRDLNEVQQLRPREYRRFYGFYGGSGAGGGYYWNGGAGGGPGYYGLGY